MSNLINFNPITFIPVYNCEIQISRLLLKFSKLEKKIQNLFGPIVIIDNNSSDKTLKTCKKYIDKINHHFIIIKNKENWGFGGTHKIAFKYFLTTNHSHMFFFHGDDQGELKDIVKFYEEIKKNNFLMCILGSRFMKNSKTPGYSKFRIFGNIVFNFIFGVVLNTKLYDMGCGFNCFTRDYALKKHFIACSNDLTFNYYLTSHIFKKIPKSKIIFIPVTWREEDQISNVKLLSQSIDLIKIIYFTFRHKENFFQYCKDINFFNAQNGKVVFNTKRRSEFKYLNKI